MGRKKPESKKSIGGELLTNRRGGAARAARNPGTKSPSKGPSPVASARSLGKGGATPRSASGSAAANPNRPARTPKPTPRPTAAPSKTSPPKSSQQARRSLPAGRSNVDDGNRGPGAGPTRMRAPKSSQQARRSRPASPTKGPDDGTRKPNVPQRTAAPKQRPARSASKSSAAPSATAAPPKSRVARFIESIPTGPTAFDKPKSKARPTNKSGTTSTRGRKWSSAQKTGDR